MQQDSSMRMDEDLRIRGEFMTCLAGGSVWKHEMNNARAEIQRFCGKETLAHWIQRVNETVSFCPCFSVVFADSYSLRFLPCEGCAPCSDDVHVSKLQGLLNLWRLESGGYRWGRGCSP